MLISLKAGGVGLNLTCASRVYFLDCWYVFRIGLCFAENRVIETPSVCVQVESGGRRSSNSARASHRADAPGTRVPLHRRQHGGGPHPGSAGEKSKFDICRSFGLTFCSRPHRSLLCLSDEQKHLSASLNLTAEDKKAIRVDDLRALFRDL